VSKPRFTKAQILAALKATRGTAYLAAEKLKCHSKTIERYLERYPELRDEIQRWRERRNDVAEVALDKALNKGASWAVQFQLSRQARARGYGASVEHQGSVNVQVGVLTEQEALAGLDRLLARVAALGISGAEQSNGHGQGKALG
jgi:hypothetical protein